MLIRDNLFGLYASDNETSDTTTATSLEGAANTPLSAHDGPDHRDIASRLPMDLTQSIWIMTSIFLIPSDRIKERKRNLSCTDCNQC